VRRKLAAVERRIDTVAQAAVRPTEERAWPRMVTMGGA